MRTRGRRQSEAQGDREISSQIKCTRHGTRQVSKRRKEKISLLEAWDGIGTRARAEGLAAIGPGSHGQGRGEREDVQGT
jgi:hypothetical protein